MENDNQQVCNFKDKEEEVFALEKEEEDFRETLEIAVQNPDANDDFKPKFRNLLYE